MAKVVVQGVERYVDGYLLKSIEILKAAVAKKWDGVVYVGGYEGDGKSEWSAQLAVLLDPSYNLDRCVFTPKQFFDAVDNAEVGQAIVYDEAQDVFESTNRDKSARMIKSKMTRIRKKRLYIIIVAPDFWRINKYMFIHRSRAFIRVYANGLQRGYFELYNREKKHELMIRGKRNEHLCVPPSFRGRFTHWFPLDEDAYDAKKEAATQEVGREKSGECPKCPKVEQAVLEADFLTNKQRAELLCITLRHLYRKRATRRENDADDGVTFTKQLTKEVADEGQQDAD